MSDPCEFGSYAEYAEAEFEEYQKSKMLECAAHGLFEIGNGQECPACHDALLPADLWRGV